MPQRFEYLTAELNWRRVDRAERGYCPSCGNPVSNVKQFEAVCDSELRHRGVFLAPKLSSLAYLLTELPKQGWKLFSLMDRKEQGVLLVLEREKPE
jgi:hypothetical protein